MKNGAYEGTLICQCYHEEHQIRVCYFQEEGDPANDLLSFDTHMTGYRGFFGRLWLAIKYVFGYKSKYGCFDSFLLKPQDARRLKGVIDDYLKRQEGVKYEMFAPLPLDALVENDGD